jgi:hypothetical protein
MYNTSNKYLSPFPGSVSGLVIILRKYSSISKQWAVSIECHDLIEFAPRSLQLARPVR